MATTNFSYGTVITSNWLNDVNTAAYTTLPNLSTSVLTNQSNITNLTTTVSTKQDSSAKDASGGYAGLTGYNINFKNATGTFTSTFTNTNTAGRTYTFPDKSGTLAMMSDVSATAVPRSIRTANTQLVTSDKSSLIDITSGTFTQTFDTTAALGNGWFCYIRNNGTGNITIPTSDGITNWIMYSGECRLFQCDGVNLTSVVITPFTATFAVTVSFVRPPGYLYFDGEFWGAGSGGAGGGYTQPGSGGGGGGYARRIFSAAEIGASTMVTIGAGGAGGAGLINTGGVGGAAGGNTTFLGLTASGATASVSGTGAGSAGAGGSGAGMATDPFVGGAGGGSNSSGVGTSGTGKLFAGSGGGPGSGGTYAGASGGVRIGSPFGAAIPSGAIGSGSAGQNGIAFCGAGGGQSAANSGGIGGNGGVGGTASGGGGGGVAFSGSYTGGAGGAGGNGYAIIRGV